MWKCMFQVRHQRTRLQGRIQNGGVHEEKGHGAKDLGHHHKSDDFLIQYFSFVKIKTPN
jgi:hypothetical protein